MLREALVRTGAWPAVAYATAHDVPRLDVEFAGAKKLTGSADEIERPDPEGFARMRDAGIRLDRTPPLWRRSTNGRNPSVITGPAHPRARIATDASGAGEPGAEAGRRDLVGHVLVEQPNEREAADRRHLSDASLADASLADANTIDTPRVEQIEEAISLPEPTAAQSNS